MDKNGKRAGKGALVQWELSGTLGVSQDQTLFVWYTNRTDKMQDTITLEKFAKQSQQNTD